MTSTVQRYQPPTNGGRPGSVSQATAVEQSRAIADVQAAVTVAQNCPRDMAEAEREMEYVCGRLDMAEQAFYQVTNRGSGPSVHLMRELARIWGNVDYGVKELARSDDRGESEVLATCWDMQKNTRSSRTFIVPHQRMKSGNRVDLTDLADIYLNNQNVGARAVRECIATILPRWFTEKAQKVCRETIANGEGEPLQDRVQAVIVAFRDKVGVSLQQLEAHVGKKRGAWSADDVAQLKIAGGSISRGEISREEVFPPIAADIVDDLPCDDDAATRAGQSKLRGKVKAAAPAEEPLVDESEPAPSEDRPKVDSEQVSAPELVDQSTPEVEPPGAPTETTPGQTDRVTAALGNARKAGNERTQLIAEIDGLLVDAGYEPTEVNTVASSVLKLRVKGQTITTSQLKTVRNSLAAWKQVGTLTDMVTGIVEAADIAAETQPDAEQQTLDNN